MRAVSAVLLWMLWSPPAATGCSDSLSTEILAKVAENSLKARAISYSSIRQYHVRNRRFGREASASVQVIYRPDAGKAFTITERSGSAKLLGVVEKLLTSESEASLPSTFADHDISPANYHACLRGSEVVEGRDCYIVELIPKRKDKYLIKGTSWVDRSTYGVVRLEGATAANVSTWVGAPRLAVNFGQFDGIWLPVRAGFASSSLLLGASDLNIQCSDYLVSRSLPLVPAQTVGSVRKPRP